MLALSDFSPVQNAPSPVDPERLAAAWLAQLAETSKAAMPREEPLPEQPIAVLAAFAMVVLRYMHVI